MDDKEFTRKWLKAVKEVAGAEPPASKTWTGLDEIIAALDPFMDKAANHGHLPTGGGMDFVGVERSREAGCLEIDIGERSRYLMKPESLSLEYLEASPVESFLLLKSAKLRPSGVTGTGLVSCPEHPSLSPRQPPRMEAGRLKKHG